MLDINQLEKSRELPVQAMVMQMHTDGKLAQWGLKWSMKRRLEIKSEAANHASCKKNQKFKLEFG